MKAFVHRVGEDGRDRLGTGVNAGRVSPKFNTWGGLLAWVRRSPPGVYHVEAFHSWDRRYGKADMDVHVTVEGGSRQ